VKCIVLFERVLSQEYIAINVEVCSSCWFHVL